MKSGKGYLQKTEFKEKAEDLDQMGVIKDSEGNILHKDDDKTKVGRLSKPSF